MLEEFHKEELYFRIGTDLPGASRYDFGQFAESTDPRLGK
jgi:hypothetical protein